MLGIYCIIFLNYYLLVRNQFSMNAVLDFLWFVCLFWCMTWLILVVSGVQFSRASISHRTLCGNWGNWSADPLNWFVLWILGRHCFGILEVNELTCSYTTTKSFFSWSFSFLKHLEYAQKVRTQLMKICVVDLHVNK